MNELFDKEMNAQKEKNSHKFLQVHKKAYNEINIETKKKRGVRKNVIDGRKHFIRAYKKPVKTISTIFVSMILDKIKVPFV